MSEMEMDTVIGTDAAVPMGDPQARSQRLKSKRVKMACQRCKSRKQKCDGKQPECSNCVRVNFKCIYKTPLYSKPQEVKVHVEALENRIAELEMTLTSHGLSEEAVDHWRQSQRRLNGAEGPERPEGSSLAAVRDVSLNIHGPFMGDTTTVALARMLESILSRGKEYPEYHDATYTFSPNDTSSESHEDNISTNPEYRSSLDNRLGNGPPPNLIRGMRGHIADKLLQAYFKNVAANYPVIHSVHLMDLHRNRDSLDSPYDLSIINLVYGLGGQYLETSGQLPYQQWRYHYEVALENRDKIIRLGNTQTLVYLLLVIQQCLRIPRDPGGWTFIGVAMRICVELGLHRKKRQNIEPTLQSELEKRQFWACYYVDRDLAISLGRPPSISDRDIDIELPLDIEEECEDPDVIKRARHSDVPAYPSTSLTCFIHMVRLKRIESSIQHKIYRVDILVHNLAHETDALLRRVLAWKDKIPPQSLPRDAQNMDTYMLYYHKCTRLLLQPQLYESIINERFLSLCAEACIGICNTYRRLHDRSSVAFSTVSLQTIFIAGLTLLYCTWQAPSSYEMHSMNALSDCSIMLYVIAERWPNVKRYRDAFETIKRSVISIIGDGKNQPREKLPTAIGDAWFDLNNFDFNVMENIGLDDLNQILDGRSREGVQNSGWDYVNGYVYDGPPIDGEGA